MSASALPRTFSPSGPLHGTVRVPGDKSISHRALILAGLAIGESRIEGLLESEDTLATAAAMRAMGAEIERGGDGVWRVHGVGVGGLLQPEVALDMGNSGTAARLLMGLVASHAITATFTGDASLSRRPMDRVIEPLSLMGADFTAGPGHRLPLTMRGVCPAVPVACRLPVASAQVKSAIFLAGLNAPGVTRVIEPVSTRDHTERLLVAFGAKIEIGNENGERCIAIHGESDLRPSHAIVPGDFSSAAFLLVAALLVPGSEVTIENVGINPTRTGLLTVLREMGADLELANQREFGGEPVADITARHSALKGIEIPSDLAPAMIDEFPILFVAAAFAEGRTVTSGLGELRLKESDRLATMAEGLRAIGARVEEREDGVIIEGSGGEPSKGGAPIATSLDHRVAMSFAVAGLVSRAGVTIDDMRPVSTSFPGFTSQLEDIRA